MNEIEMKFKVEDLSFDDLLKKFNFSGTIKKQNDFVYKPQQEIGRVTQPGDRIYRLRKQEIGDKKENIVTLKVEGDVSLASKEVEFKATNTDQIIEFLESFGLILTVNVNKTRAEFKKDGYTFCIDEVKKLGVFIELEVITDEEDATKTQALMKEYLSSLNIKGELCAIPYDTQIKNIPK